MMQSESHYKFWSLVARKANPHADTSKLEKEIDQLVYQLYELTEEEIKIVEGSHESRV